MAKLIQFELKKAPIDEVVFGCEFSSVGFNVIHYADFWSHISSEYKHVTNKGPILKAGMEFNEEHPILPRAWFETEDKKKLIQLQADRFHYNWRRPEGRSGEYPRFANLLPEYEKEWARFSGWAGKKLGSFTPKAYELTYVNHYDSDLGWNGIPDTDQVMDLGIRGNEFSKSLTALSMTFVSQPNPIVGDLTIKVQNGNRKKDRAPVLLVNVTARKAVGGETLNEWFSEAHNAILNAFEQYTPKKTLEAWGYVSK